MNLHHTLGADCKVLAIKSFLVLDDNQVVGAVVSWRHWLAVTVEELDGHVCAVLGEERNGLVTSLDSLNHMPAGCVLADEVGFAKFSNLVVGLAFGVDDLFEVVVVEGFTVGGSGDIFLLLIVVLGLIKLGHATGDWVSVHVVLHLFHLAGKATGLGAARPDWSELSSVDDASGGLASDLVGEHGEGVLSQLLVGVKAVKLLVVGAILSLGLGVANGENVGLPRHLI